MDNYVERFCSFLPLLHHLLENLPHHFNLGSRSDAEQNSGKRKWRTSGGSTMRTVILLLIPFALSAALAATPSLTLKTAVEDNKKMIIATVTQDGKPMENVSVSFYVERSFGKLLIGEDKTLEDGSAAVAAPQGMPGGPAGELKIIANATLPESATGEMKASADVAAPSTPAEP